MCVRFTTHADAEFNTHFKRKQWKGLERYEDVILLCDIKRLIDRYSRQILLFQVPTSIHRYSAYRKNAYTSINARCCNRSRERDMEGKIRNERKTE